ncbi:LysR family transcriptional regulator [Stackebrandtia nassauensis]|uniref:Transcriptional regulator, LysR family n=1 Tax=Stackebrandtia nassauensis (strain DSM 44728 / CIP 108903 / NRRL B-16338 / NBRC 102104 / LLR-40K-21) TaxID=446470 RepID=D3Q688_STANL|nr:LysR family transcriptional regulator [Stackebrandtia nassauensis]ADD42263.1 transcriptional regulator, LysR family [Stackebrandtia nassauensis DSM 44728]
MAGVERDEMEVFLTLSEELHFGRTAKRLFLSQGRVSQLLRGLEHRIGGRLFDRSSRRVTLTPLGTRFLSEAGPAFRLLDAAFQEARASTRSLDGVLRIGFTGGADLTLLDAIPRFQERYPGCDLEMYELKLSDPFGPLHRGEVDLAAVCEPVVDTGLESAGALATAPLVVGVSVAHPFASRSRIAAEELADCRMIDIKEPAPSRWRERSSPTRTPGGTPIPRGPVACTVQEVLSQIATNRGVMLFCDNFPAYNGHRDITFVPVDGLPDSRSTLIWRRGEDNARVRAFTELAVAAAQRDGVETSSRASE